MRQTIDIQSTLFNKNGGIMKSFLLMLGLLAAIGCKSIQSPGEKTRGENVIAQSEDGEEYELTIFDPDFDRWFSVNRRPASFHSLEYYEQQNRRYVQAWNQKVNQQGAYHGVNYPFENHIDYDPSIDYGLELNYKLYYYFKYIEEQFGARYDFPY